jgi:adenosine deaminase CECR1
MKSRSSLSHDFYQVMIGSESISLLGWKQLAKWSLEHSCMTVEERENVTAEWSRRWEEFCQWIIDEYDPKLRTGSQQQVAAER